MLSIRFMVLVLCTYCFNDLVFGEGMYGGGYGYVPVNPASNVQGSSNSIKNVGYGGGFNHQNYLSIVNYRKNQSSVNNGQPSSQPPAPVGYGYGTSNNQAQSEAPVQTIAATPPSYVGYGGAVPQPGSGASGQGQSQGTYGAQESLGYGKGPSEASKQGPPSIGYGQGQSQAAGGSQNSIGYDGYQPETSNKGPSAGSYGSVDQIKATAPSRPPPPPVGGYLAPGAYGRGVQGNPSYGNVGGYASAVQQTQPPTTTTTTTIATTTTTTAAQPLMGYASDAPVGQGAQGSYGGYAGGYGGGYGGSMSKKLDQPIPTESTTMTVTTEEATEESAEEETQPATTPKPCVDSHRFCAFWKDAGECEKNPAFMKINCAVSCKSC